MPRKPRQHVPGGVYHVILRGNDCQAIFVDDVDFLRLEALVAEGCERYGSRVHAYCWMTNHIHLALQVSTRPLGALMRWLGSQYARGFNRRHGRTGHVFERRHRAKLVDGDAYLVSLARYIHLNPVLSGIAARPGDYRWSSHRAYLGRGEVAWLTTRLVLSVFAGDGQSARSSFTRFVAETLDLEEESITAVRPTASSRILVDSVPTEHTLNAAGAPESRGLDSLEAIVDRHCRRLGVSPETLAAPGRARRHAKARALIARDAIETGTATLAEVARRFNRSESVILRTMNRYQYEDCAVAASDDAVKFHDQKGK